MPKILILDTYYKAFLDGFYINPAAMYETELQRLLYQSFGTFDSYSRALTALGWECRDIIANSPDLQSRWAFEHGRPGSNLEDIAIDQIEDFQPDFVFLQDVSFFSAANLDMLASKYLLAAQISCALPAADKLSKLHCVMTSFPHYVERFEKMGIKAAYVPLAFDPIVLDRVGPLPTERVHDCVFVGGVGRHWKRGHAVLEAVAQEIPTFQWWGMGLESLRPDSPLRAKYRGPAFGLDMYRIFLQSKIVLNRHGEIASGFANNLRMFEATGCGAVLFTEHAKNLESLFSPFEVMAYRPDPENFDVLAMIHYYLSEESDRNRVADAGQARTLRDHTYQSRMQTVSEVLTGMLTAT